MAAQRGSTSRLSAIKEVTPGTTPATPTLFEIPLVSFTPRHTNTVIASDQIRSHPFRDKMIPGRLVHEFGLDVELQGAVHDPLLETFFGGTITTKVLTFTDVLKSLTIEERVGATGPFNQFTFACFTSLSMTVSAGDTTPIRMSFGGMMRTGTLDAASTIATSTTAAANVDPFTFVNATGTYNTTATPIGSATINFDRALDPLMLLGSALPREFVPGLVTITGTSTVPYDASGAASGATISAMVVGFTDVAQVYKFASGDGSVFREIALPKTKFSGLGRPLSDRGVRMQEINWEAYYDSGITSAATLTTE